MGNQTRSGLNVLHHTGTRGQPTMSHHLRQDIQHMHIHKLTATTDNASSNPIFPIHKIAIYGSAGVKFHYSF